MHGGIEYTLADIALPFADNYIVLETSIKGKFHSKNIHVLIPNENKSVFKIGRGYESDIKVADISVSRTHARIVTTKEGFALEDNRSRFGTLLLLNDEPKEIDEEDGLTVQIGRSIITFSLGQKDCISLRGVDIQSIEQTRSNRKEISNT
jgi:pSer/pThr/pTyr-binding forkhead associated (FHA) protein